MHPRISIRPDVCHGKACVKGTRIPVFLLLSLLAGGDSVEDVAKAYPGLSEEDVRASLAYAADLLEDDGFSPDPASE